MIDVRRAIVHDILYPRSIGCNVLTFQNAIFKNLFYPHPPHHPCQYSTAVVQFTKLCTFSLEHSPNSLSPSTYAGVLIRPVMPCVLRLPHCPLALTKLDDEPTWWGGTGGRLQHTCLGPQRPLAAAYGLCCRCAEKHRSTTRATAVTVYNGEGVRGKRLSPRNAYVYTRDICISPLTIETFERPSSVDPQRTPRTLYVNIILLLM